MCRGGNSDSVLGSWQFDEADIYADDARLKLDEDFDAQVLGLVDA